MSGIMGIFHVNGNPVERQNLVKMVDILAHRGPDGADIWVEGAVGFGHRMLWTTPESLLEKLPFANSTGDLIITSDARIDNRDELISVLHFNNCPPDKVTDSELILAAYEKWGEQCPEHLLGDFSFAIWDRRKQSLFCARDHFGVKPFYYYYQTGQSFLFASEIKALLCLPQVPCHLNEVKVGDYLTLMMEDKAITSYKDILRLPPAHSMSMSQSEIRLWSYWSLDPNREIKLDSDQAYAKEFQKIFTEAVRCRLRSAFPIGSQLSGGLDSSAVTCVAQKILAEEGKSQLHTVSNIFDEITQCDERPFINAVLNQGGLIPHYVHADQFGTFSNLEEIWRYEEEALAGPNHFFVWELNRAAQQIGIRVFLDGFDGDTTISHGLVRLTELAQQGQWETFYQEAQGVSKHFNSSLQFLLNHYGIPHLETLVQKFKLLNFAQAVHQIHRHFGSSRRKLIIQHGLKPLVPQKVLHIWQKLRKREKLINFPYPVNPNFATRINLEKRIKSLDISQKPPLTVREEQWRSLTSGLRTMALEQSDRYSAAFSLEARHVFMDKRLIEFCLALPPEQKLYQGWTRMIMRRGLANILPEMIQWRGGKTNMTPNFLHGLLTLNRQLLDEVISNESDSIAEYVDINCLRQTYHHMTSTQKVGNGDINIVWRAANLALWLKHSQLTHKFKL